MKKKILSGSIFTVIVLLLIGWISYLLYPNVYPEKPNCIEIRNMQGETEYLYNHSYRGTYVPLSEVSQEFITTLLLTEDHNFYRHRGFDYARIFLSGIDNLKSRSLSQGASTITQQLARTLYLSNEKSWKRKINEAYIAMKLEEKYTKDYILELYINSVYFAHNLYGLGAASDYYFHKTPSELNYGESCLLVGIINAPNLYSPFLDEESSRNKWKSIAYVLYQNGAVTVEEYYDILRNFPRLYGDFSQSFSPIIPYYHEGILRELEAKNLYDPEDTELGLTVDTYLRKDIETIVEQAVKRYDFEDQIAVCVMKPYSGRVLALCGGKDYRDSQYNRALDSRRQIGSTIKPFLYYQGLRAGMSPLTTFTSEPTEFHLEDGTVYRPSNAGNIYANREITMVEALAMSDNIYAVKTALLTGSQSVAELMFSLGAKTQDLNLTLSLGAIEMTPLELCAAYNALASEGIYYPPAFVHQVTRADNIPLYRAANKGAKALREEECLMMNYMLKSTFDPALITYSTPTMRAYDPGKTFACKTGTTASSSWTVGFNPNYTILVYVGDDRNETLHDGSVSKKIWRDIATSLTTNDENIFYAYPSSLKAFRFHNSLYDTYSEDYLRKR